MVGRIIHVFPSMSVEYVLWKLSFPQFFIWHDRAVEISTGQVIKRDRTTIDEIKSRFEWDEEKGRYV
jgi:hypothetical protein